MRYGIFSRFSSPDHADKFTEYSPSKHRNIIFSVEVEKDGCLPFIDVNTFRKNLKFETTVYRKKTLVGLKSISKVSYLKHIQLV